MRINSTTTVIPTPHGHLVATTAEASLPRGSCLVAPPFGIPAKALELVLHQLVKRGISTALLDPRNHVGDSSGEIEDFTVSGYASDCLRAIAHLKPDCVVGVSLGARAMIHALALARESPAATYLLPVFDVRQTLYSVFGTDYFSVPLSEIPDRIRVLDQDVRGSAFARDCEVHGLTERHSTLSDLAGHGGPVAILAGDRDPWVHFGELTQLVAEASAHATIELRPVELDTHLFHTDPKLALALIEQVIASVDDLLSQTAIAA